MRLTQVYSGALTQITTVVPLLLAVAGCAIGAGSIGVVGGTQRHGVNYLCNEAGGCTTPGMHQYLASAYSYDPSDAHVGTVFGIYEGYASTTTATGPASANMSSASTRVLDVNLGAHVILGRYALGMQFGYNGQSSLDATGLSIGSFPLGIYGMMAAGGINLIAGVDTLLLATMSDDKFFDEDVSGHRFYFGAKLFVLSLWDDKLDLYPRVQVFTTHATGANSVDYNATGVSAAIEMGF